MNPIRSIFVFIQLGQIRKLLLRKSPDSGLVYVIHHADNYSL